MKLTFRHRFTDGRRAVMSFRGPNSRPRIVWPDGLPRDEAARGEYRQWMRTALQEAANHFHHRILYVLPLAGETHVECIEPTT